MLVHKNKVLAYITCGDRLLVFRHPEAPEAGIQVPAGTVEQGENPDAAVLREATEETGLENLVVVGLLGKQDREMTVSGSDEIHHRRFYHLRCPGDPPDTWRHVEPDPSNGEGEPIVFEFFWARLPHDVPELIADQGEMIAQLVSEMGLARRRDKMSILAPIVRDRLARRVLACLERTLPGSTARLRGSLASGGGDRYSDIDVLWEVPAGFFPPSREVVAQILGRTHPLESLRSDPSVRGTDRCLFFARFQDVPLFWRLDLEVVAASAVEEVGGDSDTDDGINWSPTESALMNAVAAVKAHLRGDDCRAREVLRPAYERVNLEPSDLPLQNQIMELVQEVGRIDPGIHDLVRRVEDLVAVAFNE